MESFKAEWQSLGRKVSFEASSKIGDIDFKALALNIRKNKPRAVVLFHLGGMLGTMVKQIRDLGYKGPIYSTSDSNDKNMFVAGAGREKGLKYLSNSEGRKTEVEIEFSNSYRDKYKDEPTSLAKEAYDSAMILSTSLKKCDLKSTCAKEKIYELKNYLGASGIFSIENDGGVSREFVESELK